MKTQSSHFLRTWCCYCLSMLALAHLGSDPAVAREAVLIAHWSLAKDANDAVGAMHGTAKNIVFEGKAHPAARFNGRNSVITIPDAELLHLGDRDFSLALWAKCETPLRNTMGDLVSKFDPDRRQGWNFHIAGSAPAYNAMSDTRHVHFGIDDGYLTEWNDCGKPCPSNSHVPCLIVFNGDLYCGIADADKTEDKAKVFRYAGGKNWVDCGRLGNDPNHYSVQSMVVHHGKLYAGTGIWNWEQARGQIRGLPPAAPTHVFVYEGGKTWRDLGQVGAGTRVLSMASFNDELYISLDPRGTGHVHKYDGEKWGDCGSPDAGHPGCLLPFGGKLYASTRDSIYEYEGGQAWKCIGVRPHGIEQIHCMQVIGGKMHLGTWPQGYVLRYAGDTNWTIIGRLGLPEGMRLCNEVNALTVYNGKLYAGVIPKAEFYRYERDGNWTLLGHLAERPDWEVNNYPTWLRLTCLVMFQGQLFGCTGSCQGRARDAPVDQSMGRVYSIQAGQVVSYERDIGAEWTHLAAVRHGLQLKLYVNGKVAATSELRDGPAFNLSNDLPMLIGSGAQNYFTGWLSDVRLYDGALDAGELAKFGATSSADQSDSREPWRVSRDNLPVVVCDADAPPPVEFAQAELRRYLGQILGAELPDPSDSWTEPSVRLSVHRNPDLSDEGYELWGEGNVFHITGGSPLGLVFGTYEFLRRFGGCRFSDLGPDGEYVPHRDRLEAEAGPARMKPELWYRGHQVYLKEDVTLSRQRIDWMAKNGFNHVLYCPVPPGGTTSAPGQPPRFAKEWFDSELLPEIRKRGLKLDMNLHNLLYWLPPDLYLADHPDWYALSNGRRGANLSQLCICTSNAEAVRTLIENVKHYLRENPEVKIVGVIPEDWSGMCQCDKCVAGDADPKAAFISTGIYGENRSKSSRYHRLLRTVAEAIRSDFPDVLVGGCAYADLLWTAPDVQLPENTIVWVALYFRDYCRPMAPRQTSAVNQRFIDVIREWKKVYRGKLLVYEYYMGRARQTTLPHPISEVICQDWPHLKKLGIEGATIQCWSLEHSAYALNNLAFARCAWHDQVDHRQVLDDYLLGAFGSVKDELRPIFQNMLDRVRRLAAGNENLLPEADNVRYFINEETKPSIHRALDAARGKAANDREHRQVEKLASAVRYWELSAELFELRAEADRLSKSDGQAARALLERALKTTCPALRSQMASLPPGWLGGAARVKWHDVFAELARKAESIH